MIMDRELVQEVLYLLEAQKEWIDAVPKQLVLPAMPGFDRDWAEGVYSEFKDTLK